MMNRFLVIIFLFLFSCQDQDKPETAIDIKAYTHPANTAMAKTLDSMRIRVNPEQDEFQNFNRSKIFQQQAGKEPSIENINLIFRSAYELILAGKTMEGVDKLESLIKFIIDAPIPEVQQEAMLQKLVELLIVAFMRQGEQANCIKNHSPASCILPLAPEAIHIDKWGSQNAIDKIEQLLLKKPDLNYVWLLNIAYMTIGKYPKGVPQQYRVQLVDYKNQEPGLLKLNNISSALKVDDNRLSGGSIIDDFNNDGYLDIVCSSWNLNDPLFIYFNNGDGSFSNKYKEAGLEGINGGLNLTHVDYNNDGFLDIFVLRGGWLSPGLHPNSLLKNNGDGTFTEVTRKTGIYSLHPTQTAAWADYNNDGFVDVFIGNESGKKSGHSCELFLNQNGEKFINVAIQSKSDLRAFVKGVSASDFDNDGDTDIYISVLNKANILLRNDPSSNEYGFQFTNVAAQLKVEEPLESFPTWFFDYNNDGWEDIFCAGYATSSYGNVSGQYVKEIMGQELTSRFRIFKNVNGTFFEDVSNKLGLTQSSFAMGSNYGDIDNDGFLDCYIGTGEPDFKALVPNRFLYNKDGKAFKELSSQLGLGQIQKGHGISFGDLDNDGDQDIYAVMGGAYEGDIFYNALFKNDNNSNSWIKLKLIGTSSNKCALGARIKIKLLDKEGVSKTVSRTIHSGSSFGQNPYLQEIGLGMAEKIEELKIYWPKSGITQIFKEPKLNQAYRIIEDRNELLPYKLNAIRFYTTSSHHH